MQFQFNKRTKKNLINLLKLCLPACLFVYILLSNDIRMAFEYLSDISTLIWICVLALALLLVFISALRLKVLVSGVSFPTMLYVRLVSYSYGFIFPGVIATEGVRLYMLGKTDGRYSNYSAAIMVDKIIGVMVVLILGTIGLFVMYGMEFFAFIIFLLIGLVCLGLSLFIFKFKFVYKNMHNKLTVLSQKKSWTGNGFGFALRVVDNWMEYTNQKSLLVKNLLLGFAYHLFRVFTGALLAYSVGAGFIFFDWLWIQAFLTIAFMLPLSFGGIGIREGALIGLMGYIGASSEQALAVSFGLLTIQLVLALFGFGLEMYIRGRNK